jgi:hypothetical protein
MTFRTIIEDHFDHPEICPATLDDEVIPIPDLIPYRLFRGHLVYVDFKKLLPQKQIINLTMLREPVSQLISHYQYIRRMPEDPYYAQVKDMTLEEYASSFTMGELKRNVQTYHIAKAAQFEIDHLSAQEVFEIAVESLNHFAFAGLVERFQDSLFLLSYIFGWRPIINSRAENIGSRHTPDLPEETLQLIQKNTEFDRQLYQQAQQIFTERFTQMLEDLASRASNGHPQAEPGNEGIALQLENYYRQRYQELKIAPASTCRYDFSQALRGSGWQRREYPTEGLIYRWTGPDTISTLDLPIARPQDLIIEFRIICTDSIPSDILNSLTLTVNETPIPLTMLHLDPVTRLLQGTIPPSVPNSSPTRLTFAVNRVISFRSLDPQDPDTRSVGVAINEIKIFPIAAENQQSLALQLFERDFWQAPIDFLQTHLCSNDTIIAPLSFKAKLTRPVQPYGTPSEWVVLQKDQTENLAKILLKLFLQGFRPAFANRVFVIFTTHSELPKVNYTSVDVKPLYVDILKRSFRKITAKFTDAP